MKKSLTILLLLSMLLTLASCGGTTQTDAPAVTASSTEPVITTEAETEPPIVYPDYDGYTFVFGFRDEAGNNWTVYDLDTEAMDGEAFNDAIFVRNSMLEERYNIEITTLSMGGGYGVMLENAEKSILAGDPDFTVLASGTRDVTSWALRGELLDLMTFETLNLDQPWWDQTAQENLILNNKLYFTTGDFTTVDNFATHCIFFSKQLIVDFSLDDPYELVRSGLWTLDKLIEMASVVTADLDGNGVMNENDRYGMAVWADNCFGLMQASGNMIARRGEGGLTLTVDSESMFNWWEKMTAFTKSGNVFITNTDKSLLDYAKHELYIGHFLENNAVLFGGCYVGHAADFRANDADFGIIPHAKFSELQERYYAAAHYQSAMVGIPITDEDHDRTGTILDAVSAASGDVTKAWYDINLVSKSLRDDDSAEMLDLIYSNRSYDLGYYYRIGNLQDVIATAFRERNDALASKIAAAKTSAEKGLAEANAFFYE